MNAGNESLHEGGWVRGQLLFIVIEISEDAIEVTRAGTSPKYVTQ